MRILFTRFPLESSYGGAEVQTLSLMAGLRDRGHDVEFLGSCPTLLKAATSCKLQATSLSIGPPPVSAWHAISFFWRRRQMRKMLTNAIGEQLPDAVFMLSMSEKLLLTEELSRRGVRVYWIEHDRIGRWLRNNPWLPAMRSASAHATTVAVSELSRALYVELGWQDARVVAIPNGIDLHRFEKNDVAQPTQEAAFHVGCVARLTQDKGIDVLIDAVADIPQATLTIIGTGREEGYLRTLIDSRGIADRVSLLSHAGDLGSAYRSFSVLVLPSRDHDPFGLAAAEAMSLGVPAVVTDACGIAGYLRDGEDALVVRAGDAGSLREALLRLLREKDYRAIVAENGKRKVHQHFSLDTMIDAYGALVEAKK